MNTTSGRGCKAAKGSQRRAIGTERPAQDRNGRGVVSPVVGQSGIHEFGQHQRHVANNPPLSVVRAYALPEVAAAHHISAYSSGALAPIEPHEEPVELLSDDESI